MRTCCITYCCYSSSLTVAIVPYRSDSLALALDIQGYLHAMSTTALLCLSPDQVCDLLSEKIPLIGADTISKFKKEKINGSAILDINSKDLKELACTLGERKAILKLIKEYQPPVSCASASSVSRGNVLLHIE